ncbi:hypothetical protein BH23ACT10_BH23ACT10_24380 [soil metagenome]
MTKPEIWGRCPSCAHWFPCPGWFQRDQAHPTCPRCDIEPTRIENRAPRPPQVTRCVNQCREDLRESLGNALSYTQQLWGLSRSMSSSNRLTKVAEQLGELEVVLEAELRRAEIIAHELEQLDRTGDAITDEPELSASA